MYEMHSAVPTVHCVRDNYRKQKLWSSSLGFPAVWRVWIRPGELQKWSWLFF